MTGTTVQLWVKKACIKRVSKLSYSEKARSGREQTVAKNYYEDYATDIDD